MVAGSNDLRSELQGRTRTAYHGWAITRPSPKQFCLVRIQYQTAGGHPVADFLYTVLESRNSGCCVAILAVQIQLRVICKGMIIDTVFHDVLLEVSSVEYK